MTLQNYQALNNSVTKNISKSIFVSPIRIHIASTNARNCYYMYLGSPDEHDGYGPDVA